MQTSSKSQTDRRLAENADFRLAIDNQNVFHLPDSELAALIADAPTSEAKAWLRGVAEARTYFGALQPTILH